MPQRSVRVSVVSSFLSVWQWQEESEFVRSPIVLLDEISGGCPSWCPQHTVLGQAMGCSQSLLIWL